MSEVDFTSSNSCTLSYSWDWKNYPQTSQELYRLNRMYTPESASDPFNYGQDIIYTKNRVRGRGVSLSLKLTSGEGKAAKINGIAVMYTAGA